MDRLSGLDASFLYFETATQPLHVCAVLELDGSTMPDGYSFDALKAELALRIATLPAFRRRPHTSRLNPDHPVWVDDQDFDVDRHVHRVTAPEPGGRAELAGVAATVASRRMERDRPLWELWVVEGLAGKTVGVIVKMHHAGVDGVAGANLMSMLCDLSSDAPAPDPDPDYRPVPAPDRFRLAGHGLLQVLRRSADLVTLVPETIEVAGGWVARTLRGEAMKAPFAAPRTSFNGTLTGQRTVAVTQLDLGAVKRIKDAFGTTVNDVVLALCAGALRDYLERRDELPDRPLVALVPVSVHDRSDRDGRNRVSGMFATLATHVADPVARLRVTAEQNATAKEHHTTISASLLQDWAQFAAPGLFSFAVRAYSVLRLAERHPVVHNLVISNVPGPPMPLYFLRARITGMFPLGPVFHGAGLNLTVLSNDGRIDVGILGCRAQVPDPGEITGALDDALSELAAAARNR